jgi:hypothetical protein
LFDAANEIDNEVKSQLVEAIKGIPLSKWEDRTFYGIEEQLVEKPSQPEAVEIPVAEEVK